MLAKFGPKIPVQPYCLKVLEYVLAHQVTVARRCLPIHPQRPTLGFNPFCMYPEIPCLAHSRTGRAYFGSTLRSGSCCSKESDRKMLFKNAVVPSENIRRDGALEALRSWASYFEQAWILGIWRPVFAVGISEYRILDVSVALGRLSPCGIRLSSG